METRQVTLRPYQKEAISAVLQDWKQHTDVLVVMATGSGKTVVMLSLLLDHALTDGDLWGSRARGLILAHRQELISQPIERIQEYWPGWLVNTGVVMADQNECNRPLTIATIQTLSRPNRMAELLAYGPIDYVVTDEVHRGVAATYLSTYEMLRAANPKLRHLGVTATPIRTDGDGLKKVFQKVSFKAGIKELIQRGYLVPFKALGVSTGISLRFVKEHDGDFVQKQLADVWECDNLHDLIVESHKRYAVDRQGIAFTVSVDGAHRLAERFNAAGIAAAAVDGTTPKAERQRILSEFKDGRVQLLANCAVLTEGFDAPATSVIHMARPTKSDLVYVQAMGRGLRTYPGKDSCLVLDYAPIESRNVIMAGDLLGKPREQKKVETEAEKAGVVIAGFSFTGEGTGIDGDPDELVTRPLNYLSASPYAWFYNDGLATLGLGQDERGVARTLALAPNGKGHHLLLIERPKGQPWDDIRSLASGDVADLADQGSDYAEELGVPVLTGRDRAWQRLPLSDKQHDLLRRLASASRDKLQLLSRGEAARLITSEFARRALRNAGWLRVNRR